MTSSEVARHYAINIIFGKCFCVRVRLQDSVVRCLRNKWLGLVGKLEEMRGAAELADEEEESENGASIKDGHCQGWSRMLIAMPIKPSREHAHCKFGYL